MLGVGGAPRGLRAHQKPLRICDQRRTLTHHPKDQEDQGKTSTGATKTSTKGGTADQASQGTCQATTPGRAAQQSNQKMLTNILSSSRQMWPEEQENFKLGHQNKPAIQRLPPQHVRNHQSHVYHLNTPIKTPTNEQKHLLYPSKSIHQQHQPHQQHQQHHQQNRLTSKFNQVNLRQGSHIHFIHPAPRSVGLSLRCLCTSKGGKYK